MDFDKVYRRLLTEDNEEAHQQEKKQKTICIDIDGTLCSYENGWQGDEILGDMLPDAVGVVNKLHDEGWLVIIFSTRNNKDFLSNHFKEQGLKFDYINENPNQPDNAKGGKPIADVYVDDRAIQFTGDWKDTYNKIKDFKPWQG